MNQLVWLAAVLLILWLILRVALALTSGALHLLWIAALVMGAIWLFHRLSGR